MSGITGAGAPTDTLISLINLMADPDAAKTRLAELKKAEDKANAAHQAAVERERAVSTLEVQLQNLRKKFDADVAAYEKDKAAFHAHQQEVNTAAVTRETTLKTAEDNLAERTRIFEADQRTRAVALSDRETVMEKRERDITTRERSLHELEAQVTRKDRALRAAMAE
jgi:RecA-family ATPase